MCGFIGGIFLDESQIRQGLIKMQHRGRDSSKIYVDEKIGLGFNRLAIIDLDSRANQPMTNENGSIWLVASGEIWLNIPLHEVIITEVEYCLNIPEHLITYKEHRKYPLIKAFEKEIPYDMLIRPKTTIQDGTKVSKILPSETKFYQEILEQIFRRH